jgi:hypothetical protein
MQDKITFSFVRFWANMRRVHRILGRDSQWYKQLQVFLLILNERGRRASWTYNQLWLETSTDAGLDAWGIRYGVERKAGETDEQYRERLVIERSFRDGKADLQAKRKRLLQYIGNIQPEELSIVSVYQIQDAQSSYAMGGRIDQAVFTRKYILYRYRIQLPGLPESQDREQLIYLISQLTIGGNVPEFREDHGAIDWMQMGGSPSNPIGSRRSEQKHNLRIY